MAAKVVFYGPGLCGKTTNLQFIFDRTSNESRGEMVSLETETDRTLFFDLLPIDVGSVAGFDTRIQLYTVPGQVFYNTTRKLVLKGVDGIVFVADSQRAMLDANQDSFRNLRENLTEMGLSFDTMPMVLQYNKRDLHDICTIDELNQALNPNGWKHFEASAISGEGVFETLQGISKLTLLSLRKRLTQGAAAVSGAPAAKAGRATPAAPPAGPPPATAGPAASAPAAEKIPRPAAAVEAPAEPSSTVKVLPAGPATRRKIDVMRELERLRQETMSPAQARKMSPPRAPAGISSNGSGELNRNVELNLERADFDRVRRFSLSFQVEDDQHQVVETLQDVSVDIANPAALSKLLLKLNIALKPKE